MATLATPGTPFKRGTIVQRASTDIWIGERDFDESPTIMNRLVADLGWIMMGGFDTCGNAYACVRRSDTICRARRRSVPGLNTITIEDNPGTDSDRMVCTHGTPLRRSCSIPRVINCSTSSADSPRASV